MKLHTIDIPMIVLPFFSSVVSVSGCGSGDVAIDSLDARVSEAISTVVTVSWNTDTEASGYVEYGSADGAFDQATPVELVPALEHSVHVLGLRANTDYFMRVVLSDEDGGGVSETMLVTTGGLPVDLPTLTVSGSGNDRYMVLPLIGTTTGPVIVDPEGEYVWYHIDDSNLDVYRARLSNDGESLLYNAASVSGDPAADSRLVRVALDGSWESTIPIPLLAHDFVELPDGTIAAIVVEYRDYEGADLRGDSIVEVAPDGTQTTVWSAWDCYDPDVTGVDPEYGWTFANAMDYDPDEDAYYLSLRNFSSIVKIDRTSGECLWALGGTVGTVSITADSDIFLHEHQFEFRDGAVLVFDNDGASGTTSRVLEYSFDEQAGTAEQIWSYTPDPSIYSWVLGDVARMENGDTFVTWSVKGQVERVSQDLQVGWQLNTDLGYALGFDTLETDLYK